MAAMLSTNKTDFVCWPRRMCLLQHSIIIQLNQRSSLIASVKAKNSDSIIDKHANFCLKNLQVTGAHTCKWKISFMSDGLFCNCRF